VAVKNCLPVCQFLLLFWITFRIMKYLPLDVKQPINQSSVILDLDNKNIKIYKKKLICAHRIISLSSIDIVLRGLPDRGRSSTIPVACKRSITEWCTPSCPATLLLLKPASDMPTAFHLPAKVNVHLTII
jgi:hypothetical protein